MARTGLLRRVYGNLVRTVGIEGSGWATRRLTHLQLEPETFVRFEPTAFDLLFVDYIGLIFAEPDETVLTASGLILFTPIAEFNTVTVSSLEVTPPVPDVVVPVKILNGVIVSTNG